MRPEVTFRRVTAVDEAFLYRVFVSTRSDLAALPLGEQQRADLMRMQFAAQVTHYRTQFPDANHVIVLAATMPVGQLYLHCGSDEHRIVDLSLLPDARGAGVGTRVLEHVLAEAQRAGRPVRLSVQHLNPARRLYERLGFVPLSETELHCLMEWSPQRSNI